MWILCLIFIYILIHGAVVMGIFWGTLTPVTVMCRVTKIKENTTQKIHTHTQRIILFIAHRDAHIPWTQAYTINHNTAYSWNYSNRPHYLTCELLY